MTGFLNDPDRDVDNASAERASAARETRVLQHLNHFVDQSTIAALQGTWKVLEEAAVDDVSHARAVRERMFWGSLTASDDESELAA